VAITDPSALLARLLKEPTEQTWLEFKQNRCVAQEIGKYISACANAAMLAEQDCAYIVFGIEDKTRRKVGTTVRLHKVRRGNENLINFLGHMLTPSIMVEAVDFEDEGLSFAILAIEPSYDRPVSFGGIEYIRIGENLKKLRNFDQHERALWLLTSRRKFEDATAAAHVSEQQVLERLDADAYYKLAHTGPRPAEADVVRAFAQRGFIKEDMEGRYDITNLGAILFAKDISTFPSVATKSVRVVKYAGRDKQRSFGEVTGNKGYAIGFGGLISYVVENLPGEESFKGGLRHWQSAYPEIALREVIANALIHQDFTVSGAGPMVEIYEDRVEVINPGNSLIKIDRIIDERRSRNEKLAAAMRALGLCEERGGGIDKAILAMEKMSLPAPEFFASEDSMRVVIPGPRAFAALSKEDRVWACFCHCVVRWLSQDYMSNSSLRARFSLPDEEYQAVSTVIANARDAGRIIPADENQGNRNARYVPYWAR
jgi:predicted HTH transcriptional regulator